MSERFQRPLRVLLGLFIVAIAVIKALEPHRYPAGDARNDPLPWIVIGAAIGGIGVGLILSAIRPGLR